MSAPGLPNGVRASDAERERVAQILQSAAAEGRLSPEEAGERLASASVAAFREELHQLIADLPVAPERELGAPFRRRPVGAWWLWSAARIALVATLAAAFFVGWGLRFLWPWGLVAVLILSRPWRRRWRFGRWRGPRVGWEPY